MRGLLECVKFIILFKVDLHIQICPQSIINSLSLSLSFERYLYPLSFNIKYYLVTSFYFSLFLYIPNLSCNAGCVQKHNLIQGCNIYRILEMFQCMQHRCAMHELLLYFIQIQQKLNAGSFHCSISKFHGVKYSHWNERRHNFLFCFRLQTCSSSLSIHRKRFEEREVKKNTSKHFIKKVNKTRFSTVFIIIGFC